MNVWLRAAAVAAAILSGVATAEAADYPAHPITLVVPYAAGGGNDVIARIVAEKMSASLGHHRDRKSRRRRRHHRDAAGRQGRARTAIRC